jgi:AcrR family transcriptional regulator
MSEAASRLPIQPATALSRRERKKRELRQRIFQSAFELFLEKGFQHTTVDDIARRADVGKGTVFNYFPRKTTFLAAVAEDWVVRLVDELGPVDTWEGTTRNKLEQAFLFLADLGIKNPALSRLAFAESLRYMGTHSADERLIDEEPVRQLQSITRTILRHGQAAGEIRLDVEAEHAAALIESAFYRTLARWLRDGGPVDDVHVEIRGKLDIIFEGLGR